MPNTSELVEAMEPKTLSFIISDLRTRQKKDTFKELLKTMDIQCRYFCRQSFAIWDVLLPSENLVKKLARDTITTNFFQLQPKYEGYRRIRITMCNILIKLNGDVLAAYLRAYGSVEEVLPVRSAAGTTHGDYMINMCLNWEGFQAITHINAYKDQNMMVVIKGRRALCWACKQIGHFARSCPQKTTNNCSNLGNLTKQVRSGAWRPSRQRRRVDPGNP